ANAMDRAKATDMSADSLYSDDKRRAGIADTARLAGSMLRNGYRLASFSIRGWDTHMAQHTQFANAALDLSTAILTLKQSLGDEAWKKSVVLATTEFGRAVRENDTDGTDHGTASL